MSARPFPRRPPARAARYPDGPSAGPARVPWLRRTITLAFAVGGLLLAGVMSLGTYLTARDYLVDQRENVARQQAFADASFVRDGLLTEARPVSEVLGAASPAGRLAASSSAATTSGSPPR